MPGIASERKLMRNDDSTDEKSRNDIIEGLNDIEDIGECGKMSK